MVAMKSEKLFLSLTVVIILFFLTGSIATANQLDEVRALIHAKGAKWIAGETSVSQLPDHEKKLRLGLVKHQPTGREKVLTLQEPLTGVSASLDWRANGGNFVTPVRNQGNCGSCWAFATTAALESYILINDTGPNRDDNRAEEILVSCSSAGSCNGGYIGTASEYIRNTGIPPETYFPYTASSADDSCSNAQVGWQNNVYKIASWSYVNTTSVSIEAIKNALNSYGPLVTTFDVYQDFDYYKTGVYEHVYGNLRGGHAVLIVGYNDDVGVSGGGYFIVKNSWGTGWGESGYFNIAYSQKASPVYFGEWTIAYQKPTLPPASPAAPSGLTAMASSSAQINLSWADNSTNEDGFKIERCAGASCSFSQIAAVGANVTTYSNTNLSANTAYSYQVRAYNAGGDSGNSNVATATTPAPPLVPEKPSILATTTASKNSMRLTWTDVANEEGYKIERCTGSGCTNFSQIASVPANTTTYLNTGLRKATTYLYRIRSYNAGGDSACSNTASYTTAR